MKVAQDRQKIYADKGRTRREFKVGDHIFLKVKANKIFLKLGNCSKLAARYCGPFEILERIGSVAYMLALPASITVHNVFHVLLLKEYILDANPVIDWNVIQVEQEGVLQVHHVRILDRKRKQLLLMLCESFTKDSAKIRGGDCNIPKDEPQLYL